MSDTDSDSNKPTSYLQYPGWCSFCRKHYRDVGPLAEGPDQVYICYHCIRVCSKLIDAECQRLGIGVPDSPPQPDYCPDEQTRKEINGLVAEIVQLSRNDISAEDFYSGFLPRVVAALAAVAGAVWTLDAHRRLGLMSHVGIERACLAESEHQGAEHTQLLYNAFSESKAILVQPHSPPGEIVRAQQRLIAANPTDFLLVLGVVKAQKEDVHLIEIFQRPGAASVTQNGYLRFVTQMCDLASHFHARTNRGNDQRCSSPSTLDNQSEGGANPEE